MIGRAWRAARGWLILAEAIGIGISVAEAAVVLVMMFAGTSDLTERGNRNEA